MPTIILSIPAVQQKITNTAENILKEKLGTEIRIESVEVELFNKFILKNLYLEDQHGDTLFHAKRLSAGFKIMPLFHGELAFTSAQLFSFQLNLNKENEDSPLNIQFVIDAFARRDTLNTESNIDLNIHTLNIRRGSFTYRIKSAQETPDVFNPKDLNIQDISAKLRLHVLTNDSINAEIERLSLKDHSGLEVKRLLLGVVGTKEQVNIENLEIWLPQSHIRLNQIQALFPQEEDHQDYLASTSFSFELSKTEITLKDLSALSNNLSNIKDQFSMQGHFYGNLNNISISDLELYTRNHLSIAIDANIRDLLSHESAYINGHVKRFFASPEGVQRIVSNFSSKEIVLPSQIEKLGNIGFKGNVSGYFRDLKANGNFSTGSGDLYVNGNVGKDANNILFINGKLQTSEFDVHSLFPENNPYGKIIFEIDLNAKQDHEKKLAGTINANIAGFEIKKHTYKDIHFNGDFTSKSFNGTVLIDDNYGKLSAEGFVKINGKASEYNFHAQASNIQLEQLNLTQKYKESNVSFDIDANMTGNSIDNFLGTINLKDFNFRNENDELALDSLTVYITGDPDKETRLISLRSNIVNGEISGFYSYADLVPAITKTMYQYLPAVVSFPKKEIDERTNLQMNICIENAAKLSEIFKWPVTIQKKSELTGRYDYTKDDFYFEVSLPRWKLGGTQMENTTIIMHNPKDKAELNINGIRYGKHNVKSDFNIHLSAKDNLLENLLTWKNREEALYKGEISASALFLPKEKETQPKVEIQIKPTHLVFSDTTWTVHQSKIYIDEKIHIDHLNIEHLDQFIKIDGYISKDTTDNLLVDLNKVNLSYIFDALNIPALELGGIATGKVLANDIYESQKLTADLNVNGFSFNNTVFGQLKLLGLWDNEEQGVALIGNIFKNDTSRIDIDGMIYPGKKALAIHFDAQNASGQFLRKYLDKIAPGFAGDVSGKLLLHGTFKDITVSGDAFVKNGGFGIDFLNTYYTFSDSIHLTDNEIKLTNILLHDKYGKTAKANGTLNHSFFDSFHFSAYIQTDNFLVYNGTEKDNPTIFGSVFGTGNARIYGTEDDVNIDITMRTEEKSKISLNFMKESDIVDFNFINFVSKKDTLDRQENQNFIAENQENAKTDETNIKMNLVLTATPDALIDFYIDPISGDKIRAWGKGQMEIQYGTHIDPRIYGKYILERGNYNFSLQQVIFKDFFIKDGSSIFFEGDPYTATLDIDAVHTLSANLTDLNPSFNINTTPMSTVTVNCLLDISGELKQPAIAFDIALPHSSNELERQVKSIISTEDMMNRQIIFLLALGRFYTQESSSTNSGQNNLASVASSTLSNQLNNLLGDLNENIQIGTNIRTNNMEEYTDTEVKLLLSSQLLNNRLLINGNLGYKDNPTDQRTFIGDFDLEYKLTKSGDIRLKAYNHYNDKYYYNIERALTTQGVGIMFRRDFDNLYELFKIIKRKPEEEVNTQSEAYSPDQDFIYFK